MIIIPQKLFYLVRLQRLHKTESSRHRQWTYDERFFFFKNFPNNKPNWADGLNTL